MSNWVFEKNYTYCSNCKVTTERITPYCPWCGETMENFRGPPAICSCYHIEYGEPRCWGTKEREVCSCNGNKEKCNFYK